MLSRIRKKGVVVIVESNDKEYGLLVDAMVQKQEVVIKSLGSMMQNLVEFPGEPFSTMDRLDLGHKITNGNRPRKSRLISRYPELKQQGCLSLVSIA